MTREVPESGSALAMRALRRATVYAFAGVGLLSLGIWKAMGVHNVSELFSKLSIKTSSFGSSVQSSTHQRQYSSRHKYQWL